LKRRVGGLSRIQDLPTPASEVRKFHWDLFRKSFLKFYRQGRRGGGGGKSGGFSLFNRGDLSLKSTRGRLCGGRGLLKKKRGGAVVEMKVGIIRAVDKKGANLLHGPLEL